MMNYRKLVSWRKSKGVFFVGFTSFGNGSSSNGSASNQILWLTFEIGSWLTVNRCREWITESWVSCGLHYWCKHLGQFYLNNWKRRKELICYFKFLLFCFAGWLWPDWAKNKATTDALHRIDKISVIEMLFLERIDAAHVYSVYTILQALGRRTKYEFQWLNFTLTFNNFYVTRLWNVRSLNMLFALHGQSWISMISNRFILIILVLIRIASHLNWLRNCLQKKTTERKIPISELNIQRLRFSVGFLYFTLPVYYWKFSWKL